MTSPSLPRSAANLAALGSCAAVGAQSFHDTDTAAARAARLVDAAHGGKDNFADDQETLAQLLAVAPDYCEAVGQAYAFIARVTAHLLDRGLTRFIDCGPQFPRRHNNIHERVLQTRPSDAAVLYVASDRVLAAHIDALMLDSGQVTHSKADPLLATSIANDPVIQAFLEPQIPVAVLYPHSLHHAPDPAAAITHAWISQLPPGSYLALTLPHHPAEPSKLAATAAGLEQVLTRRIGPTTFGTIADLKDLFRGTELVDPGLTSPDKWWPPGPTVSQRGPTHELIVAGVARLPSDDDQQTSP
ncbi:SAM-dependent methyltransferase [Fodinicola feengrottensis]|uniref:SAM-dependent methyltransferase n=1 Tax=Fodinicola feengrottensis TaxID=435914 RepID=UPI0031DD9E70